MGDESFIERAQRGDTQAFGRLVVEHAPAILRFVAGLAALPLSEREEVVQEAFVRAFERLDQFDPGQSFRAWVAGIARNVLYEHLARLKRHEQARRRLLAAAVAEEDLRLLGEGSSIRQDARLEALESCVEALPEPMRHVLRQHYAEGRSVEDIALALSRPVGTVKSILHRSRLEVRNCMARKLARPVDAS
ncbi:MAG: RNA polymerase sigma factor [Planctomycetota bacterium]